MAEFVVKFLENDLVLASLIGATAYLVRAWIERNKAVSDARVESATAIADVMSRFFSVASSSDPSEVEAALREIKSTMPKGVMFFSRRTELKANEFFAHANKLVKRLAKGEAVSEEQRDQVTTVATNFLNALRLDVLGWSAFGLSHRFRTAFDRRKWREDKRRRA